VVVDSLSQPELELGSELEPEPELEGSGTGAGAGSHGVQLNVPGIPGRGI